ncbi:MAG TPA: PIG-L family deacetylase [Ilumatobacter sp.]|nr:PIG-L family deacetylase [Ilumatobacter sp.]
MSNDTGTYRDNSPFNPAALGTILSVWAHPDDETYLAAGIMAAARDAGQRVVCASATAGELGTNDPETWPPERLGRVRRWEAAAAMAVLGVSEHHMLGLPDGSLDDHDDEGLAWAHGLLDAVNPDTVLTFGPDGMTYHPDHLAVHRWITTAWRKRGRREQLLYATPTVEHLDRFRDLYEEWNMYMSDERPTGIPTSELTVYVRLGGRELDRKITALKAMSSQTTGVIDMVGSETYAVQVCEEAYVAAGRATGSPPFESLIARTANARLAPVRAGG